MFERGWRIGRVAGVPIQLDPSVLLLAAVLALPLWGQITRVTDAESAAALGAAVLAAVFFVASILGHELAHAGASLLRGVPVVGITLYMLGGLTHQREEPRRPFDEFLITLAGPAATGVLALLFRAVANAGRGTLPPALVLVFSELALWNLIIAVFNLLPGFPLDGGRILLSAIWRVTRDRSRSLHIAARVGQVVAVLIVVGGVIRALMLGFLELALWPAIVGWFLFRAATSTLSEGARRRLLVQTTVREVMSPPPPAVPADMPVGTAVERYLRGHDGEAFPVVADGHVVGFVSLRTVRGVSAERPVREAMAGPEAVVEAAPDEPMDVVGSRLGERQVQTVLVLDDGRLIGVIEPEDLTRMLRRIRGEVRMNRGRRSE